MTQEIDMKDLKRRRKSKKRKSLVKKIIAVLMIVLIGALIYYTKDKWLPFFDGIATRYLPSAENDGELAAGKFPLSITGGAGYQVGTLENSFAILDDTDFFLYSTDGEKTVDKQHEYSNPILVTNTKKALIYDMGGLDFRLESKYKTVYTKKTDDVIILAKLCSNDNVAIVTKSDKFVSVMTIYDGSGDEIFKWKSVDSRIIDVTFISPNDGCIVTTIDASKGQLVSKLHRFSFSEDKEIWTSSNIDTMVISTQIRDDGTIVAFGDTKCAYYNSKGEFIESYPYKSELTDYSDSGKITALLFNNEERRKASLILINDITQEIQEINISGDAKHVVAQGNNALLMTENEINEYTINGTNIASVDITEEYNDFHKLGNYIFLLGYSEINRIDFIG